MRGIAEKTLLARDEFPEPSRHAVNGVAKPAELVAAAVGELDVEAALSDRLSGARHFRDGPRQVARHRQPEQCGENDDAERDRNPRLRVEEQRAHTQRCRPARKRERSIQAQGLRRQAHEQPVGRAAVQHALGKFRQRAAPRRRSVPGAIGRRGRLLIETRRITGWRHGRINRPRGRMRPLRKNHGVVDIVPAAAVARPRSSDHANRKGRSPSCRPR